MTINKLLLSAVTAIALTAAAGANAASHASAETGMARSFDVATVSNVMGMMVESNDGTKIGPVLSMIQRRGEPHVIVDISDMRAKEVFTVAMPISDFNLEVGRLIINPEALIFLENEPHFDPSELTTLDPHAQIID